MKNQKFYRIISVFIVLIISFFYINNVYCIELKNNETSSKSYTEYEPIHRENGLINNEYWKISSNGTNATETRVGINKAIEYAYNNGIESIKLEKGKYLVDTIAVNGYQRSILLKSNLSLDLNGSIIKIKPNSNTNYEIIFINNANNVEILNGILVGDRYEHDYNTINSTHEWGKGIAINASENINISNLEIFDMTGDGIFIDEYKSKISKNISVSNCNIYNSRRQGISVITADNVKIYNNEIHNINGTWPQAGIDLECDRTSQEIKNIFINNNKFYSCKSNNGIYIHSNVENVYMNNNELYGNITINSKNNTGNESIHLGNNTFKVSKTNDYSNLTTDITDTFIDTNLKNAVSELVGKEDTDRIYESDIAKIASDNVPGGKQLNLANKGITNLSGIEIFAKYNIEWIYLDNNNVTDLTPLSEFTSLTKLNASNNNISDISILKNLINLKTINLTNNKVKYITALNSHNNIEYLYLNNNKINSLDCLTNKNTIKEIYCFENQIESIDNIVNLPNLEKLDVGRNNIKNIFTIINSEKLKYLNLSENKLMDISGLKDNNIENLNWKRQDINISTGQVLENQYLLINLPQIFSTIDDTYNIEVKNLSDYELKNNYSAITISSNEFIKNGLNIIVTKDNCTYLNYLMQVDNSISEEISNKFNIINSKNEFIVTGINIDNNKVEDFITNNNFDDIYTVTLFKYNELLISNEIVTTGTVMRIYNSEKEFYQDYTIVVYGDVNGDGYINSLDALNIVSNKLNHVEEESVYIEAGRTTDKTRKEKSIPSSVDALAVVKHKLGTNNIKQ